MKFTFWSSSRRPQRMNLGGDTVQATTTFLLEGLPFSLLNSHVPWNAVFNWNYFNFNAIGKSVPHLYLDKMLESNFAFSVLKNFTFQSSRMEKGHLEVQKCFSVLFSSFSTSLGHPVKLELTRLYKFPFCLFQGRPASSRNDGILSRAPCQSWHPALDTIFPSRICRPYVQGVLQPLFQALFFDWSHELWAATSFRSCCSLSFRTRKAFQYVPRLPVDPQSSTSAEAHVCVCMPVGVCMCTHVCFKLPHRLLTLSLWYFILSGLFDHSSLSWTLWTLILPVIALAVIPSIP